MFGIGEFSRVTGLTVKTLRFYHEEGVLIPSLVDRQSGYRYYEKKQIEQAHAIAYLRSLDFPLKEIKAILANQENEDQLLELMQRQRAVLQERVAEYKKVMRLLDQYIHEERMVATMAETNFEVVEKELEQVLVAGIRMVGAYGDCGKAFGKICRAMGRQIGGKPMLLHFDTEYKEKDANFEACIPVRASKAAAGIEIHELPAQRAVTLVYRGPYEQIGSAYARVLKYVQERGYEVQIPTREVYLKGPGMIFRGNPKKYLTELQIPIKG